MHAFISRGRSGMGGDSRSMVGLDTGYWHQLNNCSFARSAQEGSMDVAYDAATSCVDKAAAWGRFDRSTSHLLSFFNATGNTWRTCAAARP